LAAGAARAVRKAAAVANAPRLQRRRLAAVVVTAVVAVAVTAAAAAVVKAVAEAGGFANGCRA